MRKLSNLRSAFVFAAFVAAAVVSFDAPLFAQTRGSDRANAVHCALLASAEATVSALPDSEWKTAALANIYAQQQALGCAQ